MVRFYAIYLIEPVFSVVWIIAFIQVANFTYIWSCISFLGFRCTLLLFFHVMKYCAKLYTSQLTQEVWDEPCSGVPGTVSLHTELLKQTFPLSITKLT